MMNSDVHGLLCKAAPVFHNWPSNYFLFLEWRRQNALPSKYPNGLRKEFREYQHKTKWRKKLGTIGKASLVYADGKLYVPEANGKMQIVAIGDEKPDVLSKVEVPEKLGREYSIFGSVAISNGKVYLATATTLFCIGQKDVKAESDPIPEAPEGRAGGAGRQACKSRCCRRTRW